MVGRALHWVVLVGFSVPPILFRSSRPGGVRSVAARGIKHAPHFPRFCPEQAFLNEEGCKLLTLPGLQHPDLAWIRERGPWLVQMRSPALTTFFVAIVAVGIISKALNKFAIINLNGKKRCFGVKRFIESTKLYFIRKCKPSILCRHTTSINKVIFRLCSSVSLPALFCSCTCSTFSKSMQVFYIH